MKVNFNKWKSLDLDDRDSLPYAAGVYAVVDAADNELCYIGKSKNLNERWYGKRHHRYPQARALGWPKLLYLEMPEHKIHSYEEELIAAYETTWNNTKVPEAKKELPILDWLFYLLVGALIIWGVLTGQSNNYATISTPAGQELRLKDQYGAVIESVPYGASVKVVGPVEADGYRPVETDSGQRGYMKDEYLDF